MANSGINIDFTTFKCMLCDNEGDNVEFVSKLRDSDKNWVIRCLKCGHVQITPLPSVWEDEQYYRSNGFQRGLVSENEKTDDELMDKFEAWADVQVTEIEPYLQKESKIIEIGSGYGWFVQKLQKRGYDITGVEISVDKCRMAKRRWDIDILNMNIMDSDIPEQMRGKYDVLCILQTLEHLSNPVDVLTRARALLKRGGRIYVDVPNFYDNNKVISNAFTKFIYYRGHLSYFTAETLELTLKKAGYSNICIRGMQIYSVENALHWIKNGTPYLNELQFFLPDALEWVNKYYKSVLEKKMTSDFLSASATIE